MEFRGNPQAFHPTCMKTVVSDLGHHHCHGYKASCTSDPNPSSHLCLIFLLKSQASCPSLSQGRITWFSHCPAQSLLIHHAYFILPNRSCGPSNVHKPKSGLWSIITRLFTTCDLKAVLKKQPPYHVFLSQREVSSQQWKLINNLCPFSSEKCKEQ